MEGLILKWRARRDTYRTPVGQERPVGDYTIAIREKMTNSIDPVFLTWRPGSVGAMVQLAAGLYRPASNGYPSAGSIGAIIGSCIEGNRRAWGSLTNRVDDDFE
jgi:hypothetical protein